MGSFRQYLPYNIRQSEVDTMEQKLAKAGISTLRLTDPNRAPPNADIWYGNRVTLCPKCNSVNTARNLHCKKCDKIIFKKNVNGRHEDRIKYMGEFTANEKLVEKQREEERLERRQERRYGRR